MYGRGSLLTFGRKQFPRINMNKYKSSLIAISMLSLSGCASIMQGTKQNVAINSSPSSATVYLNGSKIGATPMSAELSRKKPNVIKIELDGYVSQEMAFSRSVSGWVWGNIVFGGIIGLIVDASTGGMYKLTPDQINAEMKKGNLSLIQKNGDMIVAVALKADSNWEMIGTIQTAN